MTTLNDQLDSPLPYRRFVSIRLEICAIDDMPPDSPIRQMHNGAHCRTCYLSQVANGPLLDTLVFRVMPGECVKSIVVGDVVEKQQ